MLVIIPSEPNNVLRLMLLITKTLTFNQKST